jgi:phenylacetate-CoA ligase
MVIRSNTNHQWQQLTTLLHHAYDHVPYYKKLFTTQGMTPDDITSFEEFQHVPLLGKETVQIHADEFKATNYPKSSFEETNTGGSTGFSLRFSIKGSVVRKTSRVPQNTAQPRWLRRHG